MARTLDDVFADRAADRWERNRDTQIEGWREAPTGRLVPSLLYLGDNGRCFCGRLACAGASAFYSGRDLSGQEVMPVSRGDFERAGFDAARVACEGCGRKLQ